MSGVIFKLRTDMFELNNKPWIEGNDNRCKMCNLEEVEDVFHFLGICPVLNEFRTIFLEKKYLSRESIIKLLNREDWEGLYKFAIEAARYRAMLVKEFND